MKYQTLIGALAGLVMISACDRAGRTAEGRIETAGAVDAFAMQVGDCFDDAYIGSDEISHVPGVPCSDPHDNEVYALFDIPADAFPGQEEVDRLADEGCFERFEAAIGTSYEESVLVYTTMTPTQASWAQISDRQVICVAFHMEYDKLTRSVLASGL